MPKILMMENTIKIILAILLLLCLAPMPYGYFQLVRLASLVGFAYLAYTSFCEKNNPALGILYIFLAILFQPFEKIALGRTLWNIVDVLVAVFLVIQIKNEK
ncbi:DUF6804 family protein [Candidatus Ornithobacterium hominis]|nr:DUF6804 family protein [Candidatus Ornithobacterium hominis]